ncbi:MAG: histidine phosphatase family protein [Candidatus Doudnabacteria bacterium]|nr:histidine phosphatase family protein [Candidatus Doudnabacteria bacterium]
MKIRNQTTLYFIRHAQTPSNFLNIKQGIKIDEYLSTSGILDVQKNLIPVIKLLDLDAIVTSYLHRAEETASFLKQSLKDPVIILHDYRFRERDFGSLSGKTIEDIKKLAPNYDEEERFQTYDYRPFGGESAGQVRHRVITAILDLATNYSSTNIGIITHGGVIRTVLFLFPEVIRIFHETQNVLKDIANCDVYEWEIHDKDIKDLKALIVK